MISILYVIDSLIKSSGIASVLMSYVKHLDCSKYKITVLICSDNYDNSFVEDIRQNNAVVYNIEKLSFKNLFFYKNKLANFFKEHNGEFDIVHSHFCLLDRMLFPVARKYKVKKCISHSHNTRFSDYKLRSLRNKILCHGISKCADKCVACSEAAGKFLYGKDFPYNKKCVVIRNGIDVEKYKFSPLIRKNIRTSLCIDDNEIVLGTVGGLRKQKNQKFLLKLISRIVNESSYRVKLIVAGDGELRKELEMQSEVLGISSYVYFCGEVNNVSELLNSFDLFLLPSLYEGLPLVLVEAQYNGLFCISSNFVTNEAKISQNICFLELDEGTWVDKIEEMIMNERSRNTSVDNNYNIHEVVKALDLVYQEILNDENR